MATRTNELLLASGLSEVALGALTGWPYALAIADSERAKSLGIGSTPRLRQWHLDLIALGSLTALASAVVPDLPRRVSLPLAVGAWTNANAFGVLVFRPEAKDHPLYRAGAAASFITTSWGFTGSRHRRVPVDGRRVVGRDRSRARARVLTRTAPSTLTHCVYYRAS